MKELQMSEQEKNDVVTIKDIARISGVSTGTVFRVLHNSGRFSAKTAAIVNKVIKETGYSPNQFARHFSKSTRSKIGVILPYPDGDSGFWKQATRGVDVIRKQLAGFKIDIAVFYYDRWQASSFLPVWNQFLEAKCDGLLISIIEDEAVSDLLLSISGKMPIVFVDTKSPVDIEKSVFIGQDKFRAGFLAGRFISYYILSKGVQTGKILIVKQKISSSRCDGFKSFFKDYNFEVDVVVLENEAAKEDSYAKVFSSKSINDYCAIFVGDETGFIAAAYAKQANFTGPIFAFDLLPQNIEAIRKGHLSAVISQRSEQQIDLGIRYLVSDIVMQNFPTEDVYMPLILVTEDNIDEYIIDPSKKIVLPF